MSPLATVSPSVIVDPKDNLVAARELLGKTIGIDAHIDTIQRVLLGDDLGTRSTVATKRRGGTQASDPLHPYAAAIE